MKKILSILLFSIVFLSCKTAQSSISDFEHSDVKEQHTYVYQGKLNIKDSVVIRDSVVMHPDGSKSSFRSKEKYRATTLKEFILTTVKLKKTITILKKILTTKYVYVHDFFWWSGIVFYIVLFIILLYKMTKKSNNYEQRTY